MGESNTDNTDSANAQDLRPWLRPLNLFFLLITLVYSGVLWIVTYQNADPSITKWNVFIVAMGAVAVGMGLGFLYSTFGKETQAFSSFTTAINGLVAGAAATDLAKSGSIIRAFFIALAAALGKGQSPVLVAVVVVAFASDGFLFLYVNKRLLLNILTALSDQQIDDIEQNRRKISEAVRISATEPGEPLRVSEDTRRAAEVLAKSADAGRDDSLEALRADAKAFYVARQFKDAEKLARRAAKLYPQDTDILLLLANVIVADKRPADAVPVLEQLTSMTGARIEAWKLLGYCYLFVEGKNTESKHATNVYLAANPGDVGALLNIAAAMAAPGPGISDEAELRNRLGDLVSKPGVSERLQELTVPGEDFAKWKDVDWFKGLLERR